MAEARGGRIALLCAQVPPEIVAACGLEPWAVTGREGAAPDPALPPNLCALVRRASTLIGPAAREAPAGVVLSDSCYPLLRLHDHLAAGRRGILLLRVPRGRDADAVRFFRGELQQLARALESLGGRCPDDAALADAVADAARRRRERAACLAAALDGSIAALSPELLCGLAEGAPAAVGAADGRTARDGRPRLLLAGSCFVSDGLLRLLEGLGAVVAAVDACGYTRHGGEVPAPAAHGDPWTALAAGWLSRPPCPRGEEAGQRAETAAALAGRGAIDAVLYLRTANCTPQGYGLAHWRRRLRAAGVPFCAVEVDGPAWSQSRLETRLEAFVESLGGRTRAGAPAG